MEKLLDAWDYDFDSYVREKVEQLRECSRFIAWLGEGFGGEGSVLEPLERGLRDGLARLNALPRSDPFWTGTNELPTEYKLADFARREFALRPDDADALWSFAAVTRHKVHPTTWVELIRRKMLSTRWAIELAWLGSVALTLPFEPPEGFVQLLQNFGETHPNKSVRDWARLCLEEMSTQRGSLK
jgi:hypothetical protein